MPYLLDWNLDTFPCESIRDILHLENLKATAREIFARKEGSGTTTQTPCRETQSGAWNYCDSLTLAGTCLALLRALISCRILFTRSSESTSPSRSLTKRTTRSSVPWEILCPTARQSTMVCAWCVASGAKHMSITSYNSADPKRTPPGFLQGVENVNK